MLFFCKGTVNNMLVRKSLLRFYALMINFPYRNTVDSKSKESFVSCSYMNGDNEMP